MFRISPSHSQNDILSNIEQFLRKHDQEKLNAPDAWYNVFLEQVTKRIPEEIFNVLFDDKTGRPNASIRILIAMLIIKEGFGWSDETLFEAIHFNLLVRRALGLLNMTDEVPVESTYYLFKQRLYHYQVENGVNLLDEIFRKLTSDQSRRLGVIGDKLRMDSTLLDSNLAICTRLQLIIACIQVFWNSLSERDKARMDAADRQLFDKICAKQASRHIYGMDTPTKQEWLIMLGELLLRLSRTYSLEHSPRYNLIERLLLEQYQLEGTGDMPGVVLKAAKDVPAHSLQSPHDEDATYRKKNDDSVRGYSVNITETCTEELNLIVDVQVESATAVDNEFFIDAVENSEEVLGTPTKEISADGAYYSPENDKYIEEEDKKAHYTGFPGKKGRFDYERIDGKVQVTDNEKVETHWAEEYKPGRYRFLVDGRWRYFTDKDIDAASRRWKTDNLSPELFNRRCNVEATIFQLCYHTRQKKLKYRGKFMVKIWAICRAAWINMTRIASYQAKNVVACA